VDKDRVARCAPAATDGDVTPIAARHGAPRRERIMVGSVVIVIFAEAFSSSDTSGARGYAVGWFTLALINAGIAQGKNRRGITWFLVSVFLGPVATLLLVVSSDPPRVDR